MAWIKREHQDIVGTEDYRAARQAEKASIYALRTARTVATVALFEEQLGDIADLLPYRFKDFVDDWLNKGSEYWGSEDAPGMRGRGRRWLIGQLRARGYKVTSAGLIVAVEQI